jgi:hypothetical protein
MTTGFNTELTFNSRVFHVQTEDKGRDNPKIQTLIYVGGEILDRVLTDYSDLLSEPPVLESEVSHRVEEQHLQVVCDVQNGKYYGYPSRQEMTDVHGTF